MNKPLVFLLLAAFLVLLPSCNSSPDEESGRTSTLWDMREGYGGFVAPGGRQGSAGAGDFAGVGAFPGYDRGAGVSRTFVSPGGRGPVAAEPVLPITGLALGQSSNIRGAATQGALSLASVSIEVESVQGATVQVQAIAQSLGGFVEQLSSSGGSEHPRADIIIKVPQVQFTPAMERIEAMGDVQFRSLGREDVTDQHIDLSARLATYRKEEQSLTSLMERSSSVSELLSVERELARVQTNIERTQAQLVLLERQVDMATIHVALFPSGTVQAGVAAGSFTINTTGIGDRVVELREYVTGRRGVIDQFYLSSSAGEERAEVVFRVYADDFNRTARFVEGQGDVTSRKLLERRDPSGQEGAQVRRPNARIQVSYVDSSTSVSAWVPILLVVSILVLAGAVTYLMRLAYTRGRRRGSFI